MSYLQSFIFGITIAISIGPIAILILNQSINCGLKNGALCGLGAALADFTYAIIAITLGSALLPYIDNQMDVVHIFSSIILIIFSLWMIFSTIKKHSNKNNKDYVLVCRKPLAITYGLTIANPLTIIVFIGFAGLLNSDNESKLFIHAIVILIASLIIQMMIALIGSSLAHLISKPTTLLYFNLASAFGIMIFGILKLF